MSINTRAKDKMTGPEVVTSRKTDRQNKLLLLSMETITLPTTNHVTNNKKRRNLVNPSNGVMIVDQAYKYKKKNMTEEKRHSLQHEPNSMRNIHKHKMMAAMATCSRSTARARGSTSRIIRMRLFFLQTLG